VLASMAEALRAEAKKIKGLTIYKLKPERNYDSQRESA
jgi:hypothetical protein